MRRKYNLNENYFNIIDTQKKAYFLGLLYADGCNSISNNRQIILQLNEKDLHIIEEFVNDLEFSGPIKKKGTNYNITINSSTLSKKLENIGMIPNKTHLLTSLPEIDGELIHHFIRGYFDGDGYVGIANRGRKLTPTLRINIIGTHAFISNIQNIFIHKLGLSKTKLQSYSNPITKGLEYSGNKNCLIIYRYLYKNAIVFMDRKKKKFEII